MVVTRLRDVRFVLAEDTSGQESVVPVDDIQRRNAGCDRAYIRVIIRLDLLDVQDASILEYIHYMFTHLWPHFPYLILEDRSRRHLHQAWVPYHILL